jgi:hypothetical protein
VFATLASYGLSRTLTPITIGLLLQGERHAAPGAAPTGLFARIRANFESGFERLREAYARAAGIALAPAADRPGRSDPGVLSRRRHADAGRDGAADCQPHIGVRICDKAAATRKAGFIECKANPALSRRLTGLEQGPS